MKKYDVKMHNDKYHSKSPCWMNELFCMAFILTKQQKSKKRYPLDIIRDNKPFRSICKYAHVRIINWSNAIARNAIWNIAKLWIYGTIIKANKHIFLRYIVFLAPTATKTFVSVYACVCVCGESKERINDLNRTYQQKRILNS